MTWIGGCCSSVNRLVRVRNEKHQPFAAIGGRTRQTMATGVQHQWLTECLPSVPGSCASRRRRRTSASPMPRFWFDIEDVELSAAEPHLPGFAGAPVTNRSNIDQKGVPGHAVDLFKISPGLPTKEALGFAGSAPSPLASLLQVAAGSWAVAPAGNIYVIVGLLLSLIVVAVVGMLVYVWFFNDQKTTHANPPNPHVSPSEKPVGVACSVAPQRGRNFGKSPQAGCISTRDGLTPPPTLHACAGGLRSAAALHGSSPALMRNAMPPRSAASCTPSPYVSPRLTSVVSIADVGIRHAGTTSTLSLPGPYQPVGMDSDRSLCPQMVLPWGNVLKLYVQELLRPAPQCDSFFVFSAARLRLLQVVVQEEEPQDALGRGIRIESLSKEKLAYVRTGPIFDGSGYPEVCRADGDRFCRIRPASGRGPGYSVICTRTEQQLYLVRGNFEEKEMKIASGGLTFAKTRQLDIATLCKTKHP